MFVTEENRIYMNDESGNMVAEITFPETSENFFGYAGYTHSVRDGYAIKQLTRAEKETLINDKTNNA